MLPGSFHFHGAVPFPNDRRGFNFQFPRQVLTGKAIRVCNDGIIIAFGHYFAAQVACQRTHVNDMIGLPHHHLIMLHHHHRIAKVP